VRKWQTEAWERRFEILADGSRKDFKPPEIHGNPVSNEGSIVTVDWGYDLHQKIPEWAPFDVRVYRFADKTHGILGEYTEVIVWRPRITSRFRPGFDSIAMLICMEAEDAGTGRFLGR